MNRKNYIKLALFIISIFCLMLATTSLKSYSRILNTDYTQRIGLTKELEGDIKNLEFQLLEDPDNIENDNGLYYYVGNIKTGEIYNNIPKDKSQSDNRDIYINHRYVECITPKSYMKDVYFESEDLTGYIFIPLKGETENVNIDNFVKQAQNTKVSDLESASNLFAFSLIAFIVFFLISAFSAIKSIKYIENKSVAGKNTMLLIRFLIIALVALDLSKVSYYSFNQTNDLAANYIGFVVIEIAVIILMILSIVIKCYKDETLKKYVRTEFDLVKLIYTSKGFVFKILYTVLIGILCLIIFFFLDYAKDNIYVYVRMFGQTIIYIFVCIIVHIFITRLFLSKYCHKKLSGGEEIDFDFENLWFKSMMNSFIKIQNQYKGFKNTSKASIDMRNELITNMSHDIKTPLTSIINYVELIKSSENCEGDIKEYADVLTVKTELLKNLIDDLFDISKLNSGTIVLRKVPINFQNLIEQVVGELDYEIKEKNLNFVMKFDYNLKQINGDSNYLYRAINNVIINVTKYAKENTTAYIDVLQQEDMILVDIKNISENEFSDNDKNLFERFTRGDEARNTKGNGLGLAIFKEIITLHDGSCNINTIGNTFILTFTIKN